MWSPCRRFAPGRCRPLAAAALVGGLLILPVQLLLAAPAVGQEEPAAPAAEPEASPSAAEAAPPTPPSLPAPEAAPAFPPPPEPERPPRRPRSDAQVVVGSSLVVEKDEVSRDVVVFGGSLTVRGQVIGDAAVLGGSVLVEGTGEITGDLAAVGGSVTLEPGAQVLGEIVSVGGSVVGADEADVLGEIVEVPFGPALRFGLPWSGRWDWNIDGDDAHDEHGEEHEKERERRLRRIEERHGSWMPRPLRGLFEVFWRLFGLMLLALLACLAYLLASGPLDRLGRKVRTDPWRSGLVGLVAEILFLPVLVLVVLVLCVSIIGIPLLLLVPFAILGLVIVAFLGYVAVAQRIGRWCEERFGWSLGTPYLAIVVGIGLIQVWSFVGHLLSLGGWPLGFFAFMFLLLGTLLQYVVWTVGFGAALLTRFGTTNGSPSGSGEAALPPLPPPASPGSEWEPEPRELPDAEEHSEPPGEGDDWDKREI